MLRSNNHKVVEKVRLYIKSIYMGTYTDFDEICYDIFETFDIEILRNDNRWLSGRANIVDMFVYWCSGLPSILETSDYYLHKCCIGVVAEWLEESIEIANEYTESEAEELISRLICREILRGKERYIIKHANEYMCS